MPTRRASAVWEGGLQKGKGSVKTESGVLDAAHSFGSRFESAKGTNPEELLAGAEAACFAMALSGALERAGTPANPVAWLVSTGRYKAIDRLRRRVLLVEKQDEIARHIELSAAEDDV